jgi:diguanylate cyclase (GGDEF)-like protein/PAS domain S-box-containing protein
MSGGNNGHMTHEELLRALEREAAERKRLEEALKESESRYDLASRAANDGLWDWNLQSDEISFSARWKSMLGYSEDDSVAGPDEWFGRVHPEDLPGLRQAIDQHMIGKTPHLEHEYRMLHQNGIYRWVLCRGLAVRDEQGRPQRMAGSQTDITTHKLVEEELLHDAFHDTLTGLPNRALFMIRLVHAIETSRQREGYSFAVLFLDLDRFKLVNDSLGHLLGDQLLIAIARRLEITLRPGDTLARLGGDEFAILLDDIRSVTNAMRVAERMQHQLSQPLTLGKHDICVTSSIGIALSNGDAEQPEDFLRDADTALYSAKQSGKGSYQVFDMTMHLQNTTRLQVEGDLRQAVEHQSFLLHYWPIMSLQTNTLIGFEALARWEHPQRGIISPAEFIPVAEETGLIVPLGRWVLYEACRQARTWQQRFPDQTPPIVSVNLSMKQLSQPDLGAQIAQILSKTGVAPAQLKLEITESAIMEHVETATSVLSELRSLGVAVYMDDFGTGYSSLSYLQRLPIDVVKIDRSFVYDMDQNAENAEIVRAIIVLAHSLGLEVIAEGVEKPVHLDQLRELGCDYGQGFLYSRPVTAEAAETMLRQATLV